MMAINLDMNVLRSLVVAADLGGFVHAATHVGRSQSAISLQMKKLEEQVGQPLFRKSGRGVALTEAGDLVLGYARRILDLNDEAIAAARGAAIDAAVTLAIPLDLAEAWLPPVLARFHRDNPNVQVQLVVSRSRDLLAEVAQGGIDVALAFGEAQYVHFRAELPMSWIAAAPVPPSADRPLSLALLDPPCRFRQAGVEALERARLPWRLAFTTSSLSGLWAAVGAGLGVTVRTRLGLPPSLSRVDAADHLPALPSVPLVLCAGSLHPSPAARRLLSVLLATLRETVPEGRSTSPFEELAALSAQHATPEVDAA